MPRLLFLTSLCVALLPLGVLGRASSINFAPPGKQRKDLPGCYIVQLRRNASAEKRQALFNETDGQHGKTWSEVFNGFYKCSTRLEQLQELLNDEDVDAVAEDMEVVASTTVQSVSNLWHLDRIDQQSLPLDGQFKYDYTGVGTHVYIFDTGVRGTSLQFTNRMGQGLDTISGGDPNTDCYGHGTHAAGVAAGTTFGAAKSAIIHSIRVLSCTGGGWVSDIITGLNFVSGMPKPGVISMSFGTTSSSTLNSAVQGMIDKGFHVVASAGNGPIDACTVSPASTPAVIAVGSSSSSDSRSSFSNYGSCVDIFAPGENIWTASPTDDSGVSYTSGTSIAAPIVAGVIAAYLEGNPNLSPIDMTTLLQRTATAGKLLNLLGSPNLLINSAARPSLDSPSRSPSPVSATPSHSIQSPSPSASPRPSASPAPSNDKCAAAQPLICGSVVQGSTRYATSDSAPTCTVSQTAPNVWYYIDTATPTLVTLSVCNNANYDTKLTLYSGSCGCLGCIIGADDTSGCSLTTAISGAVSGRGYIMVHGYGSKVGEFTLTVTCAQVSGGSPLPTPPSPSRSPSPKPSPGKTGSLSAQQVLAAKMLRSTENSLFSAGLQDWGYAIGSLDQLSSLSEEQLSTVAETIRTTATMTYVDGSHSEILTTEATPYNIPAPSQMGMQVKVINWGETVAKAVITTFVADNANVRKLLELKQDATNPFVWLCQIDRLAGDGQLANEHPLHLMVEFNAMDTVPFHMSLHTTAQPEGVDLLEAGGSISSIVATNAFHIMVPHTSLLAIRVPSAQQTTGKYVSNNALVGLLILTGIVVLAMGFAFTWHRKVTEKATATAWISAGDVGAIELHASGLANAASCPTTIPVVDDAQDTKVPPHDYPSV